MAELKQAEKMAKVREAVRNMINLPEDAVKALTDQAINHLLSMAQFQEGKLVFVENGVVKRNPHNALNPYTAQELLAESLKNIIDPGIKAEGGPDVSGEIQYEKNKEGKITKVVMLVPDSIKTKEDLSKYLVSQGLLRGTQEYLAAYANYSPALPMH